MPKEITVNEMQLKEMVNQLEQGEVLQVTLEEKNERTDEQCTECGRSQAGEGIETL